MYFTIEEVIVITILGTIIVLFPSITFFIFFISYQKRKYKYAKEKQQLRTDFQQELLRTKLEIQEQTFQNISQEIHDNIGQMLSLLKLNLNTVDISQTQATEQKLQRSREIVAQAITDLRDLSKSLSPEAIMKIGLNDTIQKELLLMAKAGQYEANFTVQGDYYRFDPQKELIVFRIFQEILNNIIKHSKARTVNVKLDYQPQRFTLAVTDDGEGFDASKLESEETCIGLGVRNMYNRAVLIDATFTISSIPEKGTTVCIELEFKGHPRQAPVR
ncbi:MAG: sensor histidine kinase [Chitinophagaceae bacterium]